MNFTIRQVCRINYKRSKELTKKLTEIIPVDKGFSSFFKQFEEGMVLFGQLVFIGLFLGILFLMATGSIIYFKQLNDANESKFRYEILGKIGLSMNETKKIVLKSLMVIFVLPFIVGLSHSLFALGAFSRIVSFPIKNYIIFIIIIYVIIYVFYFFLTYNSYIKIVARSSKISN
jgi:putative ABC transport system permease protein